MGHKVWTTFWCVRAGPGDLRFGGKGLGDIDPSGCAMPGFQSGAQSCVEGLVELVGFQISETKTEKTCWRWQQVDVVDSATGSSSAGTTSRRGGGGGGGGGAASPVLVTVAFKCFVT